MAGAECMAGGSRLSWFVSWQQPMYRELHQSLVHLGLVQEGELSDELVVAGPYPLVGPLHSVVVGRSLLVGANHIAWLCRFRLRWVPSHSVVVPVHALVGPLHSVVVPVQAQGVPSHSVVVPVQALVGPSHSVVVPVHALVGTSHSVAAPVQTQGVPSHSVVVVQRD